MKNNPTQRAITETWVGAGWEVGEQAGVTVLSLIRFNAAGLPEHVLKIPLDDATKLEIAKQLSGGIVIARPIVPHPGG